MSNETLDDDEDSNSNQSILWKIEKTSGEQYYMHEYSITREPNLCNIVGYQDDLKRFIDHFNS